jgi:hypothetical protein
MSVFSFDDLFAPMTVRQAREKIYAIAARLQLGTTSWKPGAWMRTIFAAHAIIEAANSRFVSLILKSGFWQLSEGPWLTLCARYLAGVTRREATFASGELSLTNTGINVYNDVAVGDVTFQNSATKKTYKNAAVFSLSPDETVEVTIIADELGAASSSAPHQIDTVVTSMPGVTCGNAASVVGLDEELDPSLQRRCDNRAGAASPNGAKEAYLKYARFDVDGEPLRKPDGTLVDVNRAAVSYASATGLVTVTVAGTSGAVAGTYSDPSTDLGAIHANLEKNAVTFGVTLATQTVTTLVVALSWTLIVDDTLSLTDESLEGACAASVVSFFAQQPIGGYRVGANGYVFLEALKAAIKSTHAKILSVETNPSADVLVGAQQIPVAGTLAQTGVTRIRVT